MLALYLLKKMAINFEEVITHKQNYFKTRFEGDTSSITKDIKLLTQYDVGRSKSNTGYQSNFVDYGFKEILIFIEECSKILLEGNSFKINFWVNINRGTDFNYSHIHDKNTISAVYYHKVCCDKAPIVFEHLVPTVINKEVPFIPQDKDVIFFDGLSPHKVLACGNKNHKRISIAFNIVPHK